jgi:hypothetical protein
MTEKAQQLRAFGHEAVAAFPELPHQVIKLVFGRVQPILGGLHHQ